MPTAVNPRRCLATATHVTRMQNKSESARINQKRNSALCYAQAINPTLSSGWLSLFGEKHKRAHSGGLQALWCRDWWLVAHKLGSPKNGATPCLNIETTDRHTAHHLDLIQGHTTCLISGLVDWLNVFAVPIHCLIVRQVHQHLSPLRHRVHDL